MDISALTAAKLMKIRHLSQKIDGILKTIQEKGGKSLSELQHVLPPREAAELCTVLASVTVGLHQAHANCSGSTALAGGLDTEWERLRSYIKKQSRKRKEVDENPRSASVKRVVKHHL